MVKLLLVGEKHTSPKLHKIGPMINRFKEGNRVHLLTEAFCLTANEKAVMEWSGSPKKPSDMLMHDFKERGWSLYSVQQATIEMARKRGLYAIDGHTESPIESMPLRSIIFGTVMHFGAYYNRERGLAMPSSFTAYYGELPKTDSNDIARFASQAGLLDKIIQTWQPKNALHISELRAMGLTSAILKALHVALGTGGSFELSLRASLGELAAKGIFQGFLQIGDTRIDMRILDSLSTLDGAWALVAESTQSARSIIQANYAISWLANGLSRGIDTLVTITGIGHALEIIAELQKQLGERLWDFKPVAIITDIDDDAKEKLLAFGKRLRKISMK